MIRDSSVVVHAGFLQEVRQSADGAEVIYRPRGGNKQASFHVAWIVNCTGMERAGIAHSPLLTEMQQRGMIAADALRLGISVDDKARVLNDRAEIQPGIFAVGALTAGQFWEITAVPDIRVQARNVSEAIASAAG